MKIEIKEDKGLLTYKIDGSGLPMNSAIREYKHPSDIDKEGWNDIINESNGDILEVTYIGSERGYKRAISQAPQVSNTFILNFVDEFNQQLKLFQNNFKIWLSRLEKTEVYELASSRLGQTKSFTDLKEGYSGLELTERLNDFGYQLLYKLVPGNYSLDELLGDQEKLLMGLTKEREEIEQKIREVQARSSDVDDSDAYDPDAYALISVLSRRFELAVAHTEMELDSFQKKVNKGYEGLEVDDVSVKINDIYNQMLKSLQGIVKEFLGTAKVIDKDDDLMDLTDEILGNVSTGMANIESINFTKESHGGDSLSRKLRYVAERADQLISDGKTSNQPSSSLVGNVLRFITYLTQVRKTQLDTQMLKLLEDRNQKKSEVEQGRLLRQKLDEIIEKINQEDKKNKNLLLILDFKQSMPLMPVREKGVK